jgi:lysophospholipase L1-like esterase
MTGWTTLNLQNAINQTTLGTYDVVSLLIGVNDQYQGLDTAGYRLRFTQLINKAVSLAGNNAKKVFVLSIPDYSVTPFVSAASKSRISREIDEFNAINKQIALGYNIAYIDITPLTREVANDPSLLANDGLHYSGKEHQKWAELLAPLVKAVLQ